MAHDIVIREGLIVDGTGAPAYPGDVAIDGDTIVAVGKVSGAAKTEIAAEGNAITPGFVDLHTHLDAQAAWDPLLTPISWHGVTTALIGNCGVTFAPCRRDDQEFLANMMETVEDIPRQAIMEGLAWDWESYGEYLNSIERLHPAINVAGLVGHCASRTYVMGERAIDEDPTEDEIQQIAALVAASVKDGAVGFSSNRLPGHVLPDGRSIPGTFAKSEELSAIATGVGAHNGILQFVLDYSKVDEEMELITAQARAAGTRLLFSAPWQQSRDSEESAFEGAISAMRAEGLDVTGLTLPRSGGFLSGLTTDILLRGVRGMRELRDMTFDERLAAIGEADFRARMVEAAKRAPEFEESAKSYYWLGDSERPNYTRTTNESLYELAQACGEHPAETWLRFMLESDGQALFHVRFFNQNLHKVSHFLKQDWILPGIGDAGAHVSQIMDSGWTSFMLSHWHREQSWFTLEEAVRKMTSAQARVIGITDRGALAAGMKADINVIDVDTVGERQPKLVHDFPNGAPRLIQRAHGYAATLCNGAVILRNDELTGEQPGCVLRNQG